MKIFCRALFEKIREISFSSLFALCTLIARRPLELWKNDFNQWCQQPAGSQKNNFADFLKKGPTKNFHFTFFSIPRQATLKLCKPFPCIVSKTWNFFSLPVDQPFMMFEIFPKLRNCQRMLCTQFYAYSFIFEPLNLF